MEINFFAPKQSQFISSFHIIIKNTKIEKVENVISIIQRLYEIFNVE